MGSLCSSVGTLCSTVEIIYGLFFNIKKLRIIKELLHKGRKEDTEVHKGFF
jgi:hypothetical protein